MALFAAIAGTWLAERLLLRLAPARLPQGRLRRSLLAFASVVVHTLLLGLAAQLAWSSLTVDGGLGPRLQALERATMQLVVFAAFMIALGHALISRKRSSWRLTALSDELATRLTNAAAASRDTEVQLRADQTVPYGRIVALMGIANPYCDAA